MSQALKDPICLVSRYLSSSPSRMPRSAVLTNSPTKRHNGTGSSKVLVALEALDMHLSITENSDSEIEISGPFPSMQNNENGQKKEKNMTRHGAIINSRPKKKMVHPFFLTSIPSRDDSAETSIKGEIQQLVSMVNDDITTTSHKMSRHKPTQQTIDNTNAPSSSKSSNISKPMQPGRLPSYSFKTYTNPNPVLVYTQHEEEADDLINGLTNGPVALDIEWRVFFSRKPGSLSSEVVERRTAVVQVADIRGLLLVIQIYNMKRFPKSLQALIENPEIPKLGVNILADGKKLFRDYGILARNLVELGALASVVDPSGTEGRRKIISLAKLVEQYCGKILPKGKVRTGNWEADLSQSQLEYAANDVHSSLSVYHKLVEIAKRREVAFESSASIFSSNVPIPQKLLELVSPSMPTIGDVTSTGPSRSKETIKTRENVMMRPQYLRAYQYWQEGMSIEDMRVKLSLKGKVDGGKGEGLKAGTVISYVIGALQANPELPFEILKLRELVQLDGPSWIRHRDWILSAWADSRG